MSFGHQASAEPPCKRACLVAPKGSVANNPFRMLPGDVMAKIRVMKKLVPTPSAIAIHEAGLRFEWDVPLPRPYMAAEVATTPPAYFTVQGERTDFREFYIGPRPMNPELGVVRTNTWTRLRRRHSFEDALDYMQTLANDNPRFF